MFVVIIISLQLSLCPCSGLKLASSGSLLWQVAALASSGSPLHHLAALSVNWQSSISLGLSGSHAVIWQPSTSLGSSGGPVVIWLSSTSSVSSGVFWQPSTSSGDPLCHLALAVLHIICFIWRPSVIWQPSTSYNAIWTNIPCVLEGNLLYIGLLMMHYNSLFCAYKSYRKHFG